MASKYIFFGLAGFALIATGYLFFYNTTGVPNKEAVKGASIKAEIFVDVRTDSEWEAGHVDGAIHFDVTKMQQGQIPELAKDTPIALYCRSGRRAGEALAILKQNGFINVRNAGAFADLQTSGKKICLGSESSCN